jgi:hypothetical protein
MQHAYQMSTNRALKAKPLAVKGNVEWAESSIELERGTSRNSTECGYSYIRQALRVVQNRECNGSKIEKKKGPGYIHFPAGADSRVFDAEIRSKSKV